MLKKLAVAGLVFATGFVTGCAGLNYRNYSGVLEEIVVANQGTINDGRGIILVAPSKEDKSFEFRKEILKVDGYEINVDVYDSKASRNIIAIHSTGSYAGFLSEFASGLARRGYNVFAPDAPGHGDSSGKRGVCPMEACVHSVHSLVEFVNENYNDNIGVIGGSRGGDLALIEALKNEKVKSVIAGGALAAWERDLLDDIDGRVRFLFNPGSEIIAGILKPRVKIEDFKNKGGYCEEEDFEKMKRDEKILEGVTTGSFISFVRYKPRKGSEKLYLENLDVPVLIVACENDRLVPLSHHVRVYNRIAEYNNSAELVVLEDEEHLFFEGEGKDKVVELADEWFGATLR